MDEDQVNDSIYRAELILRHLRGELSGQEAVELESWVVENDANFQLYQSVSEAHSLENEMTRFKEGKTAAFWEKLTARIEAMQKQSQSTKQLVPDKWRWTAAASLVLLIVGAAVTATFLKKQHIEKDIVHSAIEQDIFPVNAAAELVLEDGTIIKLPENKDSSFLVGQVQMDLANNELSYRSDGNRENSESWYTLNVPRGGKYTIVLADGTKVWLNAASSLQYPTAFPGAERRIKVSGEVYLEVAKNIRQPFRVDIDGRELVEVLGTSFNINAYSEESTIRTTLFEGSLQISGSILKPGQQALKENPNRPNTIIALDNNRLESIIAWKNDRFVFNRTPIREVMKQLERWYDIEIQYGDGFNEKNHFTGEIDRQKPISAVLKMMSLTGIASFRISGRNVVLKATE